MWNSECEVMEREANGLPYRRTTALLKWLHRLGLRDFPATFLAGASGIVVPEVLHRLAEVLNDIAAVEIDVFHQRAAIVAIKDYVFMLAWRPPTFHHNTNCVGWTDRRVRNIGRNKKRFSFAHEVIHDAIAFPDAHLDVAFELVKIFLRIDEVKIVSRVRTFDHHHEKIATIIKVTIADRRFEFIAILLDPIHQIDRRLHRGNSFLHR